MLVGCELLVIQRAFEQESERKRGGREEKGGKEEREGGTRGEGRGPQWSREGLMSESWYAQARAGRSIVPTEWAMWGGRTNQSVRSRSSQRSEGRKQ